MPLNFSRKFWLCLAGFAALLLFGAGSVYLYFHAPTPDNTCLPKCLFYQLTHCYCPGCGSTRAYYSLLHGDFGMMMRYNPMLVPFAFVLVALICFPSLSRDNRVVKSILIVIIAWWILRNLPWYPFTLLAPPVLTM